MTNIVVLDVRSVRNWIWENKKNKTLNVECLIFLLESVSYACCECPVKEVSDYYVMEEGHSVSWTEVESEIEWYIV